MLAQAIAMGKKVGRTIPGKGFPSKGGRAPKGKGKGKKKKALKGKGKKAFAFQKGS